MDANHYSTVHIITHSLPISFFVTKPKENDWIEIHELTGHIRNSVHLLLIPISQNNCVDDFKVITCTKYSARNIF